MTGCILCRDEREGSSGLWECPTYKYSNNWASGIVVQLEPPSLLAICMYICIGNRAITGVKGAITGVKVSISEHYREIHSLLPSSHLVSSKAT